MGIIYIKLLNIFVVVLKGKYIILNTYVQEQETLKILKLDIQLKKLE